MDKKVVSLRKYVFTIILVGILISSFIPFNHFEVYSGTKDPMTHMPVYYYEYRSFFNRLFHYITDIRFESFLYASSIVVFYVFMFLSLVYLILDKRIRFSISLLVADVCMFILIFTNSYISTYSIIVSAICFVLLIADIAMSILWTDRIKKKELEIKANRNEKIARLIRQKRKEVGLTQKALAEKAFISRSLLSKIETGGVSISDVHLKNIASVLGVESNYFQDVDSEDNNQTTSVDSDSEMTNE